MWKLQRELRAPFLICTLWGYQSRLRGLTIQANLTHDPLSPSWFVSDHVNYYKIANTGCCNFPQLNNTLTLWWAPLAYLSRVCNGDYVFCSPTNRHLYQVGKHWLAVLWRSTRAAFVGAYTLGFLLLGVRSLYTALYSLGNDGTLNLTGGRSQCIGLASFGHVVCEQTIEPMSRGVQHQSLLNFLCYVM